MNIGILINCINVVMGTFCISLGVHYYRTASNNNGRFNSVGLIMLCAGIFTGIWNYSLAGYGFSSDFDLASTWFTCLSIGFQGYLMCMFYLAAELVHIKGVKKFVFIGIGTIISLSDIFIYGFSSSQEFVSFHGRTSYYVKMTGNSIYHFICLGVMAVYLMTVVILGMRKMQYKRDKIFVRNAVASNIFIILATLPDTLMPYMGMPSYPSSGYGALAALVVMIHFSLKYNTFDLTEENLSKYVYKIINNGVLIFDEHLRLQIFNNCASRLLGLSEESIKEYPWDIIDISKEEAENLYNRTIEGEIIYEKYSGINTGISCQVVPAVAKDEYDEPYCLILVISDSTKENAMMEEVIAANKAKSLFLANMSHEIRTPINAILGMNEMIQRESKDASINEYASDIQSAGRNLLSIINDILDFSKIESGKMNLVELEYDVSSLINDMVNTIMIGARDKKLEFNLEIDENIPARLFGDDVRIRQIITNLLSNAFKYTTKGSIDFIVKAKEFTEDGYVSLFVAVKDTGMGIKEEDIERIANSFTRINEQQTRTIEGTGLGLSITSRLLELMGSKLEISSVYGQGSQFSFVVSQRIIGKEPIGDYKKRLQDSASNSKTEETNRIAPNAKVLVVDDTEMNLKVVVRLLKKTQMQVDTAADGYKALEKLESNKYDIILLDYMMPGLNGIETLNEAKSRNLIKDTPVIALTANAITGAKQTYLEAGFNDYLSKPVKGKELEDMIFKYIKIEI